MPSLKVQSSLPILPISGLGKSGGIRKPVVKGVIYLKYNQEKPYLGLEMGGGMGGGGVVGVVNVGVVLGGRL